MSSSQTIFVTGASGFLGSHIVSLLLEQGYRVRAAARGRKVDELKSSYASFGNKFEAVSITDIVSDQFPDALKDVYAVIHTASPLPGRASNEELVDGAVQGALNVVRQAAKAGIKRIVVTSSIVAVLNLSGSFTDKDWNPVTTKEQALAQTSPFMVYSAAKTLAERELWAFADANPTVDITTFNPPFLYGPFAKGFTLPAAPDYGVLSTNLYIYRLLVKDGVYPAGPLYSDVRDVADAHVRALKSPLSSETGIGRKRLLMASIYPFDVDSVTSFIAEKRPSLKDRLTERTPPVFPLKQMPFDVERLNQVLGMKRSDFKTFEETFLAAVDDLVDLEKDWIQKGHAIEIPQQ